MKLVIAIVQEFMAQQVVDALHALPGISGASFSEVRGFGRGRARSGAAEEELLGTASRTRVEVVVRDSIADSVVEAIRRTAHTGRRGDGKVFVLPVERSVRISTGEEGDAAL